MNGFEQVRSKTDTMSVLENDPVSGTKCWMHFVGRSSPAEATTDLYNLKFFPDIFFLLILSILKVVK